MSAVGFFDRPILTGTYHSGGGNDLHYNFKAYKIGDNVEIHYYIKSFPTNVNRPIIKMTYMQFLHQFIPILNQNGQQLVINGIKIAPGTWKAKEDDIRKIRDDTEMQEMSKGGKSRRRGQRSKKRSRKTKHRRGGAEAQPASARIQMSGR